MLLAGIVCAVVALNSVAAAETKVPARWKNGLSADEKYFPIAVWMQEPGLVPRYKAAGINLYIGLWKGPTSEQLAALKKMKMSVICEQNQVGLENKEQADIVAWMHGDEPDNAQPIPGSKDYGPPIPPEKIIADYQKLRAADSTRPIFLNLGQGVAWDNWVGRGERTRHPEDYPEYAKGGDILSFDIYPAMDRHEEIAGKLEYVGNGVKRLVDWTGGKKPVWFVVECTHIENPNRKATPEQVRSLVWMGLINGASGLVYFVHEFAPKLNEAALLDDPEMLAAVTKINGQICELAPVLNSPTIQDGVSVKTSVEKATIATMVKQHGGKTYIFAVNMTSTPARGIFSPQNAVAVKKVAVRHESRTLPVAGGAFNDDFGPYQVHIYELLFKKNNN